MTKRTASIQFSFVAPTQWRDIGKYDIPCHFGHKLMRAGWSSKINQLITCEALSDDFDGKVLNPSGIEIDLPSRVLKRLKKLCLLERDRESGKRGLCERVFGLMDLSNPDQVAAEVGTEGRLAFSKIGG